MMYYILYFTKSVLLNNHLNLSVACITATTPLYFSHMSDSCIDLGMIDEPL